MPKSISGRKPRHVLPALLLCAGLAGCADDPGAFQVLGSALGGAAGGIAGSQVGTGVGRILATAAGGALGAYYGGKLFQQLAEADQDRARQAQYEALERAPSGHTVGWQNPDGSARGAVRAQQAFSANNNAPCRRYVHRISVGGQEETETGVACRQSDGSWRIVEQD